MMPDTESGVREWLRSKDDLPKAFFGLPAKGATFPSIALTRVSGAPDRSMPIDDALIQIDCWGEGTDKRGAWLLAQKVVDYVYALQWGEELSEDVVALGAYVVNVTFQPDPTTSRPRYVVDTMFTVRAA